MRHPTRWIATGVGVVVVLVAVVLALTIGSDPRAEATRSRLAGETVPTFRVVTTDGEVITSDDLAGRSTIVNFWNTWCIPCRQEEPALARFRRTHRDDPDVLLLAIVRDDTRSAVEEWMTTHGDRWTIAFDPGGQAALAFGTRGQPETFAVSPDGVVVAYQFGPASTADLETMLAAASGRSS